MPSVAKLQEQRADANERSIKKYEREVALAYKRAYDEISSQLSVLYERMGDPPSLIDARRYNRLAELQRAIAKEYSKVTRKAIDITEKSTAHSFASGAYGSQWAYDQATGVAITWPVIPTEAIRAAVWSSQSGEDFADRFNNWKAKDYIAVNQAITRSLATGASYAKAARVLKKEINKSAYQAMRIVRTESARAYTLGHLETYSQLDGIGIEARKKWVATLDTRTRDTHGYLDGQFADKDGLFYIGGEGAEGPGLFSDPAESINCRCRMVEEIDGFSPDFRRVRGEGIVPYQSFTDWAEPRGWTASTGWPIEAKRKVSEEQARKY